MRTELSGPPSPDPRLGDRHLGRSGVEVGQTQRYVWGSSTFWGNVLDLKVESMGLRLSAEQMESIRKDLYGEICKKRFLTDAEVEEFLAARC